VLLASFYMASVGKHILGFADRLGKLWLLSENGMDKGGVANFSPLTSERARHPLVVSLRDL
jgi:hypothetical protein